MAAAGPLPKEEQVQAALAHFRDLPFLLPYVPVLQYKRPGFLHALTALATCQSQPVRDLAIPVLATAKAEWVAYKARERPAATANLAKSAGAIAPAEGS